MSFSTYRRLSKLNQWLTFLYSSIKILLSSHCIKYAIQKHQDGVCLRRLFSFSGLKPTFILHINRHRKFRCLFSVCQREKRIDLTIENMV